VVRFYLLSGHYRSNFDYTQKGIVAAQNRLERWRQALKRMADKREKKGKVISSYQKEFVRVMDDDFNTPRALALIDSLVTEGNKTENPEKLADIEHTIYEIDQVLGLRLSDQIKTEIKIPKKVKKLVEQREKLRKEKKWREADKIREQILKLGYQVEDTPKGSQVKPKKLRV